MPFASSVSRIRLPSSVASASSLEPTMTSARAAAAVAAVVASDATRTSMMPSGLRALDMETSSVALQT